MTSQPSESDEDAGVHYEQCACGEVQPSALTETPDGETICVNCEGRQKGRPLAVCENCGETQPFEEHHVHGRAVSDETIVLCIACHHKYHAGALFDPRHPALKISWATRCAANRQRRVEIKAGAEDLAAPANPSPLSGRLRARHETA